MDFIVKICRKIGRFEKKFDPEAQKSIEFPMALDLGNEEDELDSFFFVALHKELLDVVAGQFLNKLQISKQSETNFLFCIPNFEIDNICLNDKYFIFHNKQEILFIDIKQLHRDDKQSHVLRKVDFRVNDEEKKYLNISSIKAGGNPELIAIVINGVSGRLLLQWKIDKNQQLDMHNIMKQNSILFGEDGDLIVVNDEKVIIPKLQCSFTCFEHNRI